MSRELDSVGLNVVNGLREFARASPGTTAVVDGARRLSYRELDDRSSRLATALLGSGLRRGSRVATLMDNRLEYIESISAIAKAGMVMVPINPRLTAPEVEFILDHSGSRGLVVAHEYAASLPAAVADLDLVLSVGSEHGRDRPGLSYEAFLNGGEARDPFVAVDERHPFCIAYTSGTTGRPKGVILTHRGRALLHYMAALEWGLGVGRVSVAVAPIYHGAGLSFAYSPTATGGTVVLLRRWDPEEMLNLISSERANAAFLVPTHATTVRALGDQALEGYDLSSLDTLYFNAAALPVPLKEWVISRFPAVGVHEVYGSTEAGVVTNLRPADALRKAGSVGHAWYMTEVRLLEDDGGPAAPGERGELFARSPFLMGGYLNDQAATEACTTEDSFLTSGDVAVADEEGFIYIVDRKKDVIVTGGVNVYPREVEDAIVRVAGVREVAVVGGPDEKWGESVAAFVVLDQGVVMGAEQLDAGIGSSVAPFKRPKSWHFVEQLPRNAAGKVLKRELRERLTPS